MEEKLNVLNKTMTALRNEKEDLIKETTTLTQIKSQLEKELAHEKEKAKRAFDERGFKAEDFALFHPGGALGKKLLLRVEDLMHIDDEIPLVATDTLLRDALFEITSKKLGVTGVVDSNGVLVGVFTDGDLRRIMEQGLESLQQPIHQVMSTTPKRILRHNLAAKALQIMETYSITSLFVFADEDGTVPVGIVHLHDLLKSGVV